MTPDSHALRKAKVYEAALPLTARGISPAASCMPSPTNCSTACAQPGKLTPP